MATHKTGGEVDAYCGRCKMTLAHTILAMAASKIARVHCNTCGADHGYRTAPGSGRAGGAPRGRAAPKERVEKVVLSFDALIAGRDTSKAKPYSPRTTFVPDDLVQHPTFGLGLVGVVRPDKVEISFRGDAKTLVHARGAEPAARPAYQPPAAASSAPADKPRSE